MGCGVGVVMGQQHAVLRPAIAVTLKSNAATQEPVKISDREISYLRRGLQQPGGKLPLFDLDGQEFEAAVIRRCLAHGWAEPWFSNPLKPDWLVCRLTASGRIAVERVLDLAASSSTAAA